MSYLDELCAERLILKREIRNLEKRGGLRSPSENISLKEKRSRLRSLVREIAANNGQIKLI